MNILSLTVAISVVITGCYAVDKTVTVGDRNVKAMDVGGVVKLYKGTDENSGVTAKISSVKEIETSGTAIGTVGTTTRSFTDFTQTTYAISAESTMLYPGSQINVKKFSLSADLAIDSTNNVQAKLTAELLVFQAEGVVSIDGANVRVRGGDVSFGVMVENWPFCGANNEICDNGQTNLTGSYLDVAFSVNGQSAATLKTGTAMTYLLGGRSFVTVSNKVMADGSSTAYSMPANYPMLATSPMQMFTSRLNPFTTSAKYSSLLGLGRDDVLFDFITFDIKGKSGKMAYCDSRNTTDGNKCITMEFDNLEEKTANDEEIKGNDHRFNTFANQDFTITNLPQDLVQGITANRTRFSSTLNNGAELVVYTYLFLDDGTFQNGNESYDIAGGDLKFSIEIKNWPFCGDTGVAKCIQNAVGEWLYFDIVMKGKGDKADKETNTAPNKGDVYDMGYGKLTLAKLYTQDGSDKQMANGYPALIQKGSKQIFRFKFSKFANMTHYDPQASLNADGDDGGDGGGDGTNAVNRIIASYATLLVVLLSVFWHISQ